MSDQNEPRRRRPGRRSSSTTLGTWLRQTRIDQQLSQTELASRARLSRSYVCNIERGYDIRPSIDALDRLGAALSVSRAEILAAAGVLEPVEGTPSQDRDARFMTIVRSLQEEDRDVLERFARFLQAEERRWNQPRLLDDRDEEPRPFTQTGPTLFDELDE